MPNSVLRVALVISALLAVLVMGNAGVASAEPDEAGNPPAPEPTSEPVVNEPQPTTPTTPTTSPPDLPSAIAGALRDFFNRPLSIFGNGRVPGQAPVPVAVNPDGTTTIKDSGRRDKPTAKPVPKPEPAPVVSEPVVPPARAASSFDVRLPFSPPVSIPLPPVTVPGYEGLRLTLDLTDPFKALSSLQETANTVNSLLADAYAPYHPVKPPAPEPQPTFKIQEEEPVIDAGGAVTPVAQSSSDPPVLQAPPLIPPVRITLPLPVTGSSPGGLPQVPVAPNAGMGVPTPRAPAAQTGSTPEGPAPPNTAAALGRPAVRQGYQQYLRSARPPQVAAIAVPGLLGLLALTASGVVTGYRQANSQRYLRSDAARFLP